jgi:hypothetical protein
VLRLHDVAEAHDFLTVNAALDGSAEVSRSLRLPEELRRERGGDRPASPDLLEEASR